MCTVWEHEQLIWLNGRVTPMLIYAALGRAPVAWLYSMRPLSFSAQAGSCYLAVLSRLAGIFLPRPRFHDLSDPAGMAVWLASRLSEGRPRIRSFEKLSGKCMSFVETDLLRSLEEALPTRFGGTGSDYQLLEEETQPGPPRL